MAESALSERDRAVDDLAQDELRRCLRDLVALAAIPSVWARLPPVEIAQSLAELVRSIVRAELSYVRVTARAAGNSIEIARLGSRPATASEARTIGAEIEARLDLRSLTSTRLPQPLGADELEIAAVPIGYAGEQGCLVVGAPRGGFPTEIERMLLTVSASQAAISLQNAAYVAELREAAHVREKLLVDLSETGRRKDEFLAMLGHELRNPLAAILSAGQLLSFQMTEDEEVGRIGEMVERQALHMTRLLDDLLDVSRVTQGKIVLRKELVALAAVVARAVEAARPLIEERGHELVIDLPEAAVMLEVDPTRLQQVISNLLTNAARYSDRGGSIRISAVAEGSTLALRVVDRGIGMAKELLPRVFELFVQADHAGSRSQHGLGIGLALVRSLVELHGGTVEARSDGPGKGSEFVILLPLPAQAASPSGAPRESASSRPPTGVVGHRVVIIDDNVTVASNTAEILQAWGCSVRVAHDGQTGIDAALSHRPSLILLDIGLPDMSGYEVAKRLRALSVALRIVAVTGYGQEMDRQRSREAGFDRHVVKPVSLDVLRALLSPDVGSSPPES